MIEIVNLRYVKYNSAIIKVPVGLLTCDNCQQLYLINDENFCYLYNNNIICYNCKILNDINSSIFYINSYTMKYINDYRKILLMYRVIKQWKYYHKKFKLIKKIIRNWIFMRFIYLNPYTEIGNIRLKLIEKRWKKLT